MFQFSPDKNEWLKGEREICFEDVIPLLEAQNFTILQHPNRIKYQHQVILELIFNDYICHIPAVKTENGYFLKTLYLSRKANKRMKKMQLYIKDLAKSSVQDETEILDIWQDVDLNSLPRLKPFMLELSANLEIALNKKANQLGVSTSLLITSILERQIAQT